MTRHFRSPQMLVKRLEGKRLGRDMLLLHQLSEPRDDVGVLRCDVVLFSDVVGQVVELDFKIAFAHLLSNCFPVANTDRLLTSVAGEFAIEERTRRLRLTL